MLRNLLYLSSDSYMSSGGQDVRLQRSAELLRPRSPHPYRRKGPSAAENGHFSSGTDYTSRGLTGSSDSADDAATEADDEKGRLLRLPAPPIRAHNKGLKGQHDPSINVTPGISPAQSPWIEKSGFDLTDKSIDQDGALLQEKQHELYAKYNRRRRGEIVRRTTEVVLLLMMCVLSLARARHGTLSSAFSLAKVKHELILFCTTIAICYATFPCRRAIALYCKGMRADSAILKAFHVPSRFDPGPLLYPIALPISIALSLGHLGMSSSLNVILGLASMPQAVMPFSGLDLHYGRWVVSLIPLSVVSCPHRRSPSLKIDPDVPSIGLEELCLIPPLHRVLVSVISDLVGKSLDPSEIELMSSGLTNLLVLANNPQAQILKALLWAGGLSIFVLGEPALRAEVALARVPSWRFARNRPSSGGLVGRMNRLLRAILPGTSSVFAISASSDSEDEGDSSQSFRRSFRLPQKSKMASLRTGMGLERTTSANERPDGANRTSSPHRSTRRSATFSVYGRATTMAIKFRKLAESPNPYPRLNFLHAQALKYMLAVFVFVTVTFVILVPIRCFISSRALLQAEPVGWALGYFIGDLPTIRLFVVKNNWDWWLRLPTHKMQATPQLPWSWLDTLRTRDIGAANLRLLLAGYCVLMVTIGITIVLYLKQLVEVDTRRKVFHGVMVAMLLPTIPIDPTFFALALEIVLVVFLMLDTFRASQLPPISRPLTTFLAPYIDGRDYRGPVVVSHIFLLIGCATPLWLSLAGVERKIDDSTHGWELDYRNLGMVSGVICVGMGDAAASLIGRRYGRTKWYWGGGKSIEGSTAFALAVWVGLMASWSWLRIGGWLHYHQQELLPAMTKSLAAAIGSSVMESTLTAANDNVVVPIGLWLLVRGLRI